MVVVGSGDEFGPTSELLEDFHDLQVNGMVKLAVPWEPKTFIFRGYNPYFGV